MTGEEYCRLDTVDVYITCVEIGGEGGGSGGGGGEDEEEDECEDDKEDEEEEECEEEGECEEEDEDGCEEEEEEEDCPDTCMQKQCDLAKEYADDPNWGASDWPCDKFVAIDSQFLKGDTGTENFKHKPYGYVSSTLSSGYAAFTEYFQAYAPFEISSGYRCPIGNGNLPEPKGLSRHVRGYAVDVTGETVDGDLWPPGPDVPEKLDIREWAIATYGIPPFEFKSYNTTTHVHLGWPHNGNMGPLLVQRSDHEVTMTKAVLFSASLALLAPSAAGAQEHEHKGNWPPVRQTFSSDEMVARIATLDPAQAMPALNSMWKEGTSFTEVSERVTPQVVAAMLEALDYLLDQDNRASSGLPYDDLDGVDLDRVFTHEGLFETLVYTVKDMFHVAPELRDPRAIPVLLKASSMGVQDIILDFGPRAVLPHTLACVFNPETLEWHLVSCLHILAVIVGVWGESIDE